jgi:hypothetical protein
MEMKDWGKVRSPTKKEDIPYGERQALEGKKVGLGKGGLNV